MHAWLVELVISIHAILFIFSEKASLTTRVPIHWNHPRHLQSSLLFLKKEILARGSIFYSEESIHVIPAVGWWVISTLHN